MPDCLTLWKWVRDRLSLFNITDVQQAAESLIAADPATSAVLEELLSRHRQFSVDTDDRESTVPLEPIIPAALLPPQSSLVPKFLQLPPVTPKASRTKSQSYAPKCTPPKLGKYFQK